MANAAAQKINRMLTLMPYLAARPGITLIEAAKEFGMTPRKLEDELIHMMCHCSTPGSFHEYLDLEIDEGEIYIINTQGMNKPLRLTSTEATSLLLAIRAIIDQPGLVERRAALSALAKIEAAAGLAQAPSRWLKVADTDTDTPAVQAVRAAVAHKRAARLKYYSASRDQVTERIVDPVQIVLVSDHSYLQAWCRESEGIRLFRFDRIQSAHALDEPSVVPADADLGDFALFTNAAPLPVARLRLESEAAWLADEYSVTVDEQPETPGGPFVVSLNYGSLEWMVRLLLGFGSAVEVLAPVELKTALQQRARDALAAYAAG